MSHSTGRMSLPRKLGYAVGNFGLNIYWQSLTYFLLYFYTDVVGLSGATAGAIYMVASMFDAAIDPVAGVLMDRTRTRWGRYRPWIAIGAVPLALSFMLLYLSPSLEGSLLVVAVTASHLLFRICYTTVAVPFNSLTARITQDQAERTQLTALNVLFASAAGSVVALLTQPLVQLAGGAQNNGFFWAATLGGVVATAIFAFVAMVTREPAEQEESEGSLSLTVGVDRAALGTVFKNRAFLLLVSGLLFATFNTTVLSKSMIYYFKYVVGDESASRGALTFATTAAFVLVPIWATLGRFFGKRAVWLLAVAVGLVGAAFLGLVQPVASLTTTAAFAIMQTGTVGIAVAYWALLPDTVEYGEWAGGVRLESFLFGLFMFVQKMGLGAAAGLFGFCLSQLGYDPGSPNGGGLGPALPSMIAILCGLSLASSGTCAFFSPLRKGVHEDIVAEVRRRRAA
ncbi:MFS transporter [Novosphingobium taihuense]|uniref:GPH family glycoside/pentoside/hexuronide:cation symporter n=1 Tax=Novosphingobium taihuense TaxID=260085 RepID=A0A7W7AAU7_9SPHN|nr:glycoside-pentoside-hexuronide (GPH):cation symporter [Novosphingobium taihuense]MBB4612855.1 GPH family glycoside/pentoside/hexuronide:cation symporter [Novosphingobium taihuense]TWH81956.1 GPH family glycoside/pentoside/hexuronide:cation symporter [Novosphingobium taihuense]